MYILRVNPMLKNYSSIFITISPERKKKTFKSVYNYTKIVISNFLSFLNIQLGSLNKMEKYILG